MNVDKSIGTIITGLTAAKKPILVIPSKTKSSVELTINEKAKIYIYAKGIRISARSSSNNLGIGLQRVKTNPGISRKILPHSKVNEAIKIILNIR